MAQLSDDCFAFGGALLPLADAQARIAEAFVCVVGAGPVALADACGRVLAQDVVAPVALPPATNAAVDGYAVRHADLAAGAATVLPVRGRVAAGHPPDGTLPPGAAARIFTGALMPDGADTVFMQEDCALAEDGSVRLPPGLRLGANCRPRGEDVAQGARALPAGRRLAPPDVALLAALGIAQVPVRTRLRVAVFSTGDEIADPHAPLPPGAVHDANRPMLLALLGRLGIAGVDGGILPDDRDRIRRTLAEAAASTDAVLTSGGVSAGEEDHVRAAIADAGTLQFWRVGIKPGRPVALASVAGVPLLGLPGNPVAALVTFMAIARPLLDRLSGATHAPPLRLPVACAFAWRKKAGRREYLRATLDSDGRAHRYPKEGAGIITSLTESDVLLELPEEMTELVPGTHVPCIPLALLHG